MSEGRAYTEGSDTGCREQRPSTPFRVASFPRTNTGNPYVDLFYRALEQYGVQRRCGLQFDLRWLRDHAQELDALHFHWPERLWRGRCRGRLDRVRHAVSFGRLRGVARLRRYLDAAGRLGLKRIWTVHNLGHHEGTDRVDRWGYRTLASHCDLLICHSRWAAERTREQFGTSTDVVVMRHGTYDNVYPQPRPRRHVAEALGLREDLPIVSCVGTLRRYKGIEIACEATTLLGDKVQLVVGGSPSPSADRPYWQRLVDSVPGAVLLDRSLSDQEFSDVIASSDALLLPYVQITGSGALLAAWTLGTSVVASDLPFFQEMLHDYPMSGTLFETGNASALAEAIEHHLSIPPHDRNAGVAEAAREHSWARCVAPVGQIVRSWQRADT